MSKLYYTPPDDGVFKEVKEKAIEVWKEVASHPAYLDEKVKAIEKLENVRDNMMYIVAMFDLHNQKKLAEKLSKEAKKEIVERLVDGGDVFSVVIFNRI